MSNVADEEALNRTYASRATDIFKEASRSINEFIADGREDFQTLAAIIVECRRALSVTQNAPIQEAIDLGLVKSAADLLGKNIAPHLQFEIIWIMTNVASGTTEQARKVVGSGAMPWVLKVLKTGKNLNGEPCDLQVLEQCMSVY